MQNIKIISYPYHYEVKYNMDLMSIDSHPKQFITPGSKLLACKVYPNKFMIFNEYHAYIASDNTFYKKCGKIELVVKRTMFEAIIHNYNRIHNESQLILDDTIQADLDQDQAKINKITNVFEEAFKEAFTKM